MDANGFLRRLPILRCMMVFQPHLARTHVHMYMVGRMTHHTMASSMYWTLFLASGCNW